MCEGTDAAVVVTVESVGRRRGADVFFWDADDPPRERDREFFLRAVKAGA